MFWTECRFILKNKIWFDFQQFLSYLVWEVWSVETETKLRFLFHVICLCYRILNNMFGLCLKKIGLIKISTFTRACITTHTHTYTHTYSYIYTHIYRHTYSYTYIHIFTLIHTHIHIHIHTYTHIFTLIHTHIHIHIHTHIHTHTHIFTYIDTQYQILLPWRISSYAQKLHPIQLAITVVHNTNNTTIAPQRHVGCMHRITDTKYASNIIILIEKCSCIHHSVYFLSCYLIFARIVVSNVYTATKMF